MIDRELQKKWEKKLQSYGLGIDQPMTDNSEGELAQASSMPSVRGDKHPDHARLRTKMDSNDQFLKGGFGIKTIRSLEREIPEWTANNEEVQKVITLAFPRMKRGKVKRYKNKNAQRWASIIHLYYRMGLPQQIVAKELRISEHKLKRTLQSINRTKSGLRTDGKARLDTPPTPHEG